MCNVTHTDISPGFKTDHSMVTIQVELHTNPRGPRFWKLNTSFLSETEYINQIRTTIEGVKDEYQNDKSVNASLPWERFAGRQKKFSCLSRSGIVHKFVRECHRKPSLLTEVSHDEAN